MTNRAKFIDYVKNGGNAFVCSPQIGAGAGFDTKLAGKTWMSRTSLQDTVDAVRQFDMIPLINTGLPSLTALLSDYREESVETWASDGKRRTVDTRLYSPVGSLHSQMIEEELKGCCPTQYYITDEEQLPVLSRYLDDLLAVTDFSPIAEGIKENRRIVGDDMAMDVQWAMQPYELLGFPNTMDTAVLALEAEEEFRAIMDKILALDEKLLDAAAEGGTDFVFLGGPGSEMISPAYYEKFLVPYSQIVSQMAHQKGLLVYTHICSPIEPMLTMGYYNQMGIDLFETLSPYPVGNVKSIEDAFGKLSPDIYTRGNIGLDDLMNHTPEQVYETAWHILETARKMGRKHMLAASDYMFYETKVENVRAMCRAVRDFNETGK